MLSSFRTAARSHAICIPSHVSGVLPNAFESRMAIPGLIADLPLTTLLSACRVMPRTFAPAITERPKGARQSCRTMRPPIDGVFHGHGVFFLTSGSRSVQRQRRQPLAPRGATWSHGVMAPGNVAVYQDHRSDLNSSTPIPLAGARRRPEYRDPIFCDREPLFDSRAPPGAGSYDFHADELHGIPFELKP